MRRIVGTVRSGAPDAGRVVEAIELRSGPLVAEIWTFGAGLVRLEAPGRDGVGENVVLRHADLTGYDDPDDRAGYLGATIGRWANRIREGRCDVGGRTLDLERNDGANHLHGGVGFDQRVWVAESTSTAVTLRRTSPAGEAGYPGTVEVTVRYSLVGSALEGSALEISYEATSDAPTPLNLTNHAYWNLAGGGRIDGHVLRTTASRYLPVDGGAIPVGGPAPVAGTRFDFVAARPIGDEGVDHCLLPDGDGFRVVAELDDPGSGRRMLVESDQPALQLYTADQLIDPHTAVCLETQRPPDAPNQPDLGPWLLEPGETYRHRTRHTFSSFA